MDCHHYFSIQFCVNGEGIMGRRNPQQQIYCSHGAWSDSITILVVWVMGAILEDTKDWGRICTAWKLCQHFALLCVFAFHDNILSCIVLAFHFRVHWHMYSLFSGLINPVKFWRQNHLCAYNWIRTGKISKKSWNSFARSCFSVLKQHIQATYSCYWIQGSLKFFWAITYCQNIRYCSYLQW